MNTSRNKKYYIEQRQDELLLQLAQNDDDKEYILNTLKELKQLQISIVGVGGVGSICAELLIRSGITNLHLIDGDIVEESNIGRQNFLISDISKPKVECIKKRLNSILNLEDSNKISSSMKFISSENIESECSSSNIIIDCSDNLQTRNAINDFCLKHKKDWIFSGAQGFESIVCYFNYSATPSSNVYSKLMGPMLSQTATCSSGVLNSSTQITASLILKELLLNYCNSKTNSKQHKTKCIKFNSLHNKIFEINI